MNEYRFTVTITPMSENDLQHVIDDIRKRFGRKHLVHVIGKQPSNTHVDEARVDDDWVTCSYCFAKRHIRDTYPNIDKWGRSLGRICTTRWACRERRDG